MIDNQLDFLSTRLFGMKVLRNGVQQEEVNSKIALVDRVIFTRIREVGHNDDWRRERERKGQVANDLREPKFLGFVRPIEKKRKLMCCEIE